MIRVKLKGINIVSKRLADGATKKYYYHRATGISLPGEPGSDEFISAYHKAQESIKSAHRNEGTLKALIQRYMQSPKYLDLRDRTRKDYFKHIGKIEEKFGSLPIPALNDPHVRSRFLNWRDKLGKSSKKQADYTVTVLGIVLEWSLDRGFIEANHIRRPKKLYKANRSEKIWLQEHVDAFLDRASDEIAFALLLALDTGQRQGDLLKLSWAAYDGEYLNLQQSKTGTKVSIPLTARLTALLQNELENRSKNKMTATTILTRTDGQPWKQDHFRHEWRRTTKEAGLDNLTFNDLRGTAVTALADAGCTLPEICSITGHSLKSAESILSHYLAGTKRQADSAILKLENVRRTKVANQTANRSSNGKEGKS